MKLVSDYFSKIYHAVANFISNITGYSLLNLGGFITLHYLSSIFHILQAFVIPCPIVCKLPLNCYILHL